VVFIRFMRFIAGNNVSVYLFNFNEYTSVSRIFKATSYAVL